MENLTHFFSNNIVMTVLFSICAFFVSCKIFPVISLLSFKKNLMEEPVDRSSHTKKTPNLGGIGIFITFLVFICLSGSIFEITKLETKQLFAIISAVSILFFIGVKDDLIGISPLKKLISQFIAAGIIIFAADLKIDNFYHLFGIGELPYLFSVLFTGFLFLFITNAYNLIDGIDGLAGVEGSIISLTLGLYFMFSNQLLAGLSSFILLACFLGFLCFNLSNKNKIFMGDSGSLFIGFLLMVQALLFLKLDLNQSNYILPHKLVLLFTLFAFPVLDTIRVFFLRIKKGGSPFVADRNHLHHRLLDLGLSHINATITISVSNLTLICIAFLTSSLGGNTQLAILTPIAIGLFYSPFLIKAKALKRKAAIS